MASVRRLSIRRRRSPRWALGVAALAVAAGSTLVALRRPLAARLLRARLAAQGLDVSRLEVAEAGLYEAQLRRLSLAGDAIRSAELLVSYRPLALLRGHIERLELRGVMLKLDVTGGEPPGGVRLPAAEHNALMSLGLVVLRDARVEILTPRGKVDVAIAGGLRADAQGHTRTRLRFDARGAPGILVGSFAGAARAEGGLEGSVNISDAAFVLGDAALSSLAGDVDFSWRGGWPDRLDAHLSSGVMRLGEVQLSARRATLRVDRTTLAVDLDVTAAGGALALSVHGRAEGLPELARLALDASADVALPEGGRVCLDLAASGTVPLAELSRQAPADAAMAAAQGAVAKLSVELEGVNLAGVASGVSGALRVDGALAGRTLSLALAPGARLGARGFEARWLEGWQLPAELAAELRGGGSVAGSGRAEVGWAPGLSVGEVSLSDVALQVRTGSSGLELSLEGAAAGRGTKLVGVFLIRLLAPVIALDPFVATGVDLTLPARLGIAGDGFRLDLSNPGELRAATLAYAGEARLAAPVCLQLGGGFIDASWDPSGGLRMSHDLRLAASDLDIVFSSGAQAIRAACRLGALSFDGGASPQSPYRGHVGLASADVEFPDLGLSLAQLSADVDLAAVLSGNFAFGRVHAYGEPPPFKPFALQGVLRRDGDDLGFEGEASFAAPLRPWTIAARQSLTGGGGELSVASGAMDFAPGAIQPKDLAPPLAGLSAVRGKALLEARARWGAGDVQSTARLSLDDVSLHVGALGVQGLTSDLRFDSLAPLRSSPDQRVRVRRLDAGMGPALEDLSARFAIKSDRTTRIDLGEIEASFGGGKLSARGAEVDPAGGPQALTVAVSGLDLGQLLHWTEVDGLSGEGRLDGSVPLAVVKDELVVAGGQLAARGPGVLSYRSAKARELLAGSGESVDLLIRALEDFRYSELKLTLSHAVGDETTVGVNLLGSNPAVLDGYPFRINVNLRGNTRSLLGALSQSYLVRHRVWMRASE